MRPKIDVVNMFVKDLRRLGSHLTRFLAALVLIMAILFMTTPLVQAANVLHAKPIPSGEGDCTSWEDACSLQEALVIALSGDQIWVQAGVHIPGSARSDTFTLKNGVAIYGGFAGTDFSSASEIGRTTLPS